MTQLCVVIVKMKNLTDFVFEHYSLKGAQTIQTTKLYN